MKFESGKINTSPAFQRHSVWKKPDRLKLINLILNNKPIPTIFFYERNDDNGNKIYDVIDGKQRLETIVKYFDPKNIKQLDPIQGKFIQDSKYIEVVEFKSLDKDKKSQFTGYKIALIQVSGEYEDILDLFININSLGAPLKTSEIRNAKFIQSPWIKYINDFQKNKTGNKKLILVNEIFKRNNVDRMAKEEFILELLISVFTEEVHDGKTILDKILSDRTSRLSQTKKMSL